MQAQQAIEISLVQSPLTFLLVPTGKQTVQHVAIFNEI